MGFGSIMTEYCARAGWQFEMVSERQIVLRFSMESGRVQTMHVLCFDETLELSVQSALYFENLAAVPHNISTDLMRKSCTNKVGMWVLEEISGKYVYSLMHNCVLDELTDSGFERSVRYMISRVEEFDAAIYYLSGQSSSSIASEFGREFARSAGARLGAVAVGALFSFLSS